MAVHRTRWRGRASDRRRRRVDRTDAEPLDGETLPAASVAVAVSVCAVCVSVES